MRELYDIGLRPGIEKMLKELEKKVVPPPRFC
jgi:hypothetical protein